jgi:hypothetical protein
LHLTLFPSLSQLLILDQSTKGEFLKNAQIILDFHTLFVRRVEVVSIKMGTWKCNNSNHQCHLFKQQLTIVLGD